MPFSWFLILLAMEASIMLALIMRFMAPWAHSYILITAIAQVCGAPRC